MCVLTQGADSLNNKWVFTKLPLPENKHGHVPRAYHGVIGFGTLLNLTSLQSRKAICLSVTKDYGQALDVVSLSCVVVKRAAGCVKFSGL